MCIFIVWLVFYIFIFCLLHLLSFIFSSFPVTPNPFVWVTREVQSQLVSHPTSPVSRGYIHILFRTLTTLHPKGENNKRQSSAVDMGSGGGTDSAPVRATRVLETPIRHVNTPFVSFPRSQENYPNHMNAFP